MKLATFANHTPDGALHLVSRALTRTAPAAAVAVAATLQQALDRWDQVEPRLRDLAERLEAGTLAFDSADVLAPLPRAWRWLDGSVCETHGDLLQKRHGPAAQSERPVLMYQGISGTGHGGLRGRRISHRTASNPIDC